MNLKVSSNEGIGLLQAIDNGASCFRNMVGWRCYGMAFLAGAIATLALPPANFLPALPISFVTFIWLLDRPRTAKFVAFTLGFSFGFGYFVFGLYWIGNALLVFGDRHAWMLPFAILGLPAVLSLFTGCAATAASFAQGRMAMILAVTVSFAAMDWLRGHVLTGLPWNLFGYSWGGIEPLLQSTALYGIYGTGFMSLICASLFAGIEGGSLRRRTLFIGFALLILGIHMAYGIWRLSGAPTAYLPGIGFRLVQANIPQREKWVRRLRSRNIDIHQALSVRDRPEWITHVVWPEMAATLFLADDEHARMGLAATVPPNGVLITGAPRRAKDYVGSHNSVLALDALGRIIEHYDKSRLVPFGEYVPLASILPIRRITDGIAGYHPGRGIRTLRLPGLPPISVLVCYEIIFSGQVVDQDDRPSAILNLTNDAWYGVSAGPYQHFANARVRAVEEGLPVIRAAYTGISGVFDPYGRVIGTIALNERGFLDVRLPRAIKDGTLYAEWMDFPFLILLVTATASAYLLTRRSIKPLT